MSDSGLVVGGVPRLSRFPVELDVLPHRDGLGPAALPRFLVELDLSAGDVR